jgi:hypothetical protein
MLGGAAALGAGALLGQAGEALGAGSAGPAEEAVAAGRAGPAAAASGVGRRVFSHWLGSIDGHSGPLHTPRRFALAGVEWTAPGRARIELRTRLGDGSWGRWAVASVRGHDGDAHRPSPLPAVAARGASSWFGEPVWVGDADTVQLRSTAPIRGVRVHFVAAPVSGEPLATAATAARPLLATPVLDAGPGQPPIIARSVWADDHAPPERSAYYGDVKFAVVHHTENPNGYSRGDVVPILRSIFDYHRYVRGFFDIAYNFIIDAFGRIWEARAGGIEEPVIGAHAGGFNQVSTGVAVLGTFISVVPPPAAIASLGELLAWKLALHGLPALGKVSVEVDPADAFYTPFRPGAIVRLPRIAGHRDADLTDCPGDAFYHRLPRIRPRVAALEGVPASLTLTAVSEAVPPGTQLALSGRLGLLSGAPLPGATILLQQLAGDTATTLLTATTGPDGSWTAVLPIERNIVLSALHADPPASVSASVTIGVKPVLTLTLAAMAPAPLAVTGTIAPPKPRVTLDVYRIVRGRRRLIHQEHLPAVGGAFSARVLTGAKPGQYVLVARTPENRGTLAGASPPLDVTV